MKTATQNLTPRAKCQTCSVSWDRLHCRRATKWEVIVVSKLLEPKIFSNEQLVGGIFYMKNDGVKVRDYEIPNWMESQKPFMFQSTKQWTYTRWTPQHPEDNLPTLRRPRRSRTHLDNLGGSWCLCPATKWEPCCRTRKVGGHITPIPMVYNTFNYKWMGLLNQQT